MSRRKLHTLPAGVPWAGLGHPTAVPAALVGRWTQRTIMVDARPQVFWFL